MQNKTHVEIIKCPECNQNQSAIVEETIPFYTYIHKCNCGYLITESDWIRVDPQLEVQVLFKEFNYCL